MHSILHQITQRALRVDRGGLTNPASDFGHNCMSGWLRPKPDTSHQSSDTLEAALKASGARERRSNIHFTLPLRTLTDAVCFDLSLANQLLSAGLCPESRLELAACPMPNGTAWSRERGAIGIHSNQQCP